jgi:hypothetical protein
MKNLFLFLPIVIFLSSCVHYGEPDSLSLSGEYRVDKITYELTDNTQTSNSMVFYPGDMYVNPNEKFPLDTIMVGFTPLHLDYSTIRFKPILNSDGSKNWTKEYFYYVHGHTSIYDLGYITFECEGTQRVWKIVDDAHESLVLRTQNTWSSGSAGPSQSLTIYLTRVGP